MKQYEERRVGKVAKHEGGHAIAFWAQTGQAPNAISAVITMESAGRIYASPELLPPFGRMVYLAAGWAGEELYDPLRTVPIEIVERKSAFTIKLEHHEQVIRQKRVETPAQPFGDDSDDGKLANLIDSLIKEGKIKDRGPATRARWILKAIRAADVLINRHRDQVMKVADALTRYHYLSPEAFIEVVTRPRPGWWPIQSVNSFPSQDLESLEPLPQDVRLKLREEIITQNASSAAEQKATVPNSAVPSPTGALAASTGADAGGTGAEQSILSRGNP